MKELKRKIEILGIDTKRTDTMGSKRADEIVAGIKAKKRGTPQSPRIPQAAMAEPDKNAPAAKPLKADKPKEPRAPSHSQVLRMATGQASFADARLPAPIEEDVEGIPGQQGTEFSARVQQLEAGNQELRGMVKALAHQVVQLEEKIESVGVKPASTKPAKAREGTVVDREEDCETLDEKDIIIEGEEPPELKLADLEKKHPKVGTTVQSVAPVVSEGALAIVEAYCKERGFVTQSQILRLISEINSSRMRLKENVANMMENFGMRLKEKIAKLVDEK